MFYLIFLSGMANPIFLISADLFVGPKRMDNVETLTLGMSFIVSQEVDGCHQSWGLKPIPPGIVVVEEESCSKRPSLPMNFIGSIKEE